MQPYAIVTNIWSGGPTSFDNPDNQEPLVFSKQELIEFGGADKEKINFTLEYNVEEMPYAPAITIYVVFDKGTTAYMTNLKSVQGTGKMSFRMGFLPRYDNLKKVGTHKLEIVVKLRPQFTLWKFLYEKVIRRVPTYSTVVVTPAVKTCDGTIVRPAVVEATVQSVDYIDTYKETSEFIMMKPIAESVTSRTVILNP